MPTFVDYLKGGLRIDLAVAIDFTLSNGPPDKKYSLHHIGSTNQYEQAMWDVGSILEPYSYDQLFPTFGFGAVPPGGTQIEHCFPLNGDPANPAIQGIDQIQAIYRHQLPHTTLAGPTIFGPILHAFNSYAAEK